MFYKVRAKFYEEKAKNFLVGLENGSIASQEPDGPEIVASMKRARLGQDGIVRWTEMCFCQTPLAHERGTVYDNFFFDMKTEETEKHEEFEGKSFMDYLRNR